MTFQVRRPSGARGTIVREVEYPHPPERVWLALTDRAALSEWLMPTDDFAPVVGCRFTFRTRPQLGWSGLVECEVLEVDPPRRLSYRWWGGGRTPRTVVRWTLEPTADGTRLRLEHDGLRGVAGLVLRQMLGRGWEGTMLRRTLPRMLDRLAASRPQAGSAVGIARVSAARGTAVDLDRRRSEEA